MKPSQGAGTKFPPLLCCFCSSFYMSEMERKLKYTCEQSKILISINNHRSLQMRVAFFIALLSSSGFVYFLGCLMDSGDLE